MSDSDINDLLERAHHWIEDSPGEGHAFHCRVRLIPPEHRSGACNCGRDVLLADLRAAFTPPDFQHSNGGEAL